MNIAIIGGGTAGAAAALFLARDGHRVELHERVPEPAPLGAGVLIQPTGLGVLRALGLAEEILAKGAPVFQLYGTSHTGRVVMNLDYNDWLEGAHGLGLHRGVLFHALWCSLQGAGVDVHTGSDISSMEDDGTRVTLRRGEAALGPYDLVVVADGTRSTLRAGLPIRHRAKPYPWGALWAVLPDPQQEYRGCLRQWYRRAGQMLGVMPTGAGPDSHTPVVSLFWSLRADRLDHWKAAGLAAWKREVADLAPETRGLLARIGKPEQMTWAGYSDVVMRRWHSGRVAVIGDCAHAMSPQLGQGANLALIDAQVLAACVREHADDPSRALAAYTKSRRGHLRYYQRASRWLTPVYQSDARLLPALRDTFCHFGSKLPPVRTHILDTLVGVKAGLFSGRYAGTTEPTPGMAPASAVESAVLIQRGDNAARN
ncbi:MAG: FAD-dependent monooxygenase [Betaproteobacteria bacterium]|nr:FAD-dependent monooxygenase [Betaproteobacteria bacterium]